MPWSVPRPVRTVLAAALLARVVETRLRPVPDRPALLVEPERRRGRRTLVVADLHLGLGGTRERPGGPPEGSADRLAEELLEAVRRSHADRLVVAGDAKHPIVGTPAPLRPIVFRFFSRLLEEDLPVTLVPGNHDVGIVPHLPREVDVPPPSGTVVDGVGIFHGHRWPSDEVLRAPRLVAGHLHPGFRLAPTPDDPEGKRRCWVRVELSADATPRPPKGREAALRARELVIVPAFNPIAGTEALNRERPARGRSFLYRRFLARGVSRAYLLDGTDLGRLPSPPPAPSERRATPRAPPGR